MIQRESLNFILQSAQESALQAITSKIQECFATEVLQPPTQQTLMLPVKDPISGGEFYAGEVLVTTSLVALLNKANPSLKAQGWAMVLDDMPHLALCLAMIDAYFGLGLQDSITQEIHTLALQTQEEQDRLKAQHNHAVDKTRVNFELM